MIRSNRWMTGLAVLAAMALAMAMALGGVLYAQSAGADIPLLGKLQKGFHDPNGGLLDAWNVDYEAGAALPAGVRSTETVFHHLETLAASSGTHVAAGGTFPSNNVDGTIFLANAHFTVSAGIAQDILGVDITQIQRGDIYRYNGANSHWIEISGFGFIPDNTILERMLKIQGNPALGECVSWDGTDLEWSTCATGAIAVADGSITTDKLHDGAATGPKLAVGSVSEPTLSDGAVTEPKLAMYNRPANGEVIEWDQVGNRMQWSPVNSLSLADNSITEPKLDMQNSPANGEVIEWDQVANRMQWSPVSSLSLADDSITEPKLDMHNSPAHGEVIEWDQVGNRMQWSPVSSPSLADNSVTEPKLYMYNTPLDGHVIEWDQATGRMQWTSVGNLSLLNLSVTSNKLADDAVTEPKLALGSNAPTDNQVITWNASGSGSMDWEDVAQAGIGLNAIDTDMILNNTILPVDLSGGAVVTDKIRDGNVTEPKLAISNGPADGQFLKWDTNSMEWATVTTGTPDDNSVTSIKIVDGEVKETDIGPGAVTGAKIQDGSVTEPKLAISGTPADDQFIRWNSGGMHWETVTTGVPAADSITSAMIMDGEVKAVDIGAGAVTGAKIPDGAVTEPKLAISLDPTNGQFLRWDAGSMEWANVATQTISDDSITNAMLKDDVVDTRNILADAVTSTELHDDSVTEPKLAVGGTQSNGLAIMWDGATSGGAMQWAQIIAESVEADAITEPKLAISDDPSNGQVLTWDGGNTIMKWATAGSSSITADSVTEDKLAIENTPTSGYALLWDGAAGEMAWGRVSESGLLDDAVTQVKLADNAVTSSNIFDGQVHESDLAIHGAGAAVPAEYQLNWTSTAMEWIAPWKNVIRLMGTLPSSATEIAATDEAGFIGKISAAGNAVDALYFKAESKALSIRMDDITDRLWRNNLILGYSKLAENGLYKKGGAVHPSVPGGFTYLIEGKLGSNRILEMRWEVEADRPPFADTIYVDSGIEGKSRVALAKVANSLQVWRSGTLTGDRVFPTPHDTYTVSFWNDATSTDDDDEYVPTSLTADYLARVVDEQHLLESDGKIISQINDVYSLTAHGSYRGDFDATRGGYAEGDMVTAQGSAGTGLAEVIFIAVEDIVKGTNNLAFPHADRGNWVEISNGFEEYLYGDPLGPGVHIPQDSWQPHTLTRGLTEYDDDRDIILEFEHTHTNAGSGTTNKKDVFTFVEMGPVDRWRTFDAKTPGGPGFGTGVYGDRTLANSMCRRIHNFSNDVATFTSVSTTQMSDSVLVCIAKGATDNIMLIFASEQIYTVNTYIVLR